MSRLIDADAITNSNELATKIFSHNLTPYIKVEDLIAFIDNLPTIEAVPVVHGEWVPHNRMVRSPLVMNYACSVCGKDGKQTSFCPNCGAKMKGGAE